MQTKSKIILALAILSFIVGVAGQYFYPDREISPVDMWTMPVFICLVFWWYRLDTTDRAYKRSPLLNVGVIGLAAIALPIYFFRSRGFKGGSIATLVLFGAVIASGLLTVIGQTVTYLGLQS